MALIILFGSAWLLNGSFTAAAIQAAGGSLGAGWSVHLGLTAIELCAAAAAPYLVQLPRPLIVTIYALTILAGAADVFTSAVGLMPWMSAVLAGGSLRFAATIGGEVIAYAPEPMLVWLIIALHRIYRGA